MGHRSTTDAGTLKKRCRIRNEDHLTLSVVVTEAEISLVLVKSYLCIIFLPIIMKSTSQQCKNERTSFYWEDL